MSSFDRIEDELQHWYRARQAMFWRWARENEADPVGAIARRWERREERQRLERRIRELETLRRVQRADLARRVDVAGLCQRLLRLIGESSDDA